MAAENRGDRRRVNHAGVVKRRPARSEPARTTHGRTPDHRRWRRPGTRAKLNDFALADGDDATGADLETLRIALVVDADDLAITRSAYRPLLDTTIFFASFGLSFALLCHTLRGFGKPFSQISS